MHKIDQAKWYPVMGPAHPNVPGVSGYCDPQDEK